MSKTRDEQSIFVPPTLVPGLSHLGGLGLSKSTFNPFGNPSYPGPKMTTPIPSNSVIGQPVFSPSSSPVPALDKKIIPSASFSPNWQPKTTPPPGQSSPAYPSWNSTPPPPSSTPSNPPEISNILASLDGFGIRLTEDQLEKLPGVKREKTPNEPGDGDGPAPMFPSLDGPISSPMENSLFPSNSFLPPLNGEGDDSRSSVFPSAHDFSLSKSSGFPSPIGRKKSSWDISATIPDRSPGTPPTTTIGGQRSIGVKSGSKWDSPPLRGHSPVGMPPTGTIGSGLRPGKSKSIDSNASWGTLDGFNPGVIGQPSGLERAPSSGRSILGLDLFEPGNSFGLDFSRTNGTDHPVTSPEHFLLKQDSLGISSGLDPEFKKKVEDLLRNDHDDELDLFPEIAQAKIEENGKSRFIELYGMNNGLDHLDSIARMGTSSNVEIAPKTAAAILAATPSVRTEPTEAPNRTDQNPTQESVDLSSGKLIGHELIKPEQTGILPEQLQQSYKFARVCASCFIQRRVGFDGFHFTPPPGHQCSKNILVVRSTDSDTWCRVRNMPRHIDYRGPFLLCRHISQGEACPYADACTFCYNEEEQDIWAWERRGLFNRTRLFTETVVDPIAHFLRQYPGQFFMAGLAHIDEPNACNCNEKNLYYLGAPGLRPVIIRDTPDEKTMELCRYSSTNRCNRGNQCYFAHSMVELDAWRIFVSTGGTPDCILEVVQEQNTMMEVERPTASSSFAYKHRWICAQCYKNGQIVERKGKTQYCTSRGNPHSWRDPLLYVHIEKWSIIRDLLVVFSKSTVSLPITFVVCKNIRDKHRCDYGDVCQFAHSEEECKIWNYMKENNVKSLKDLYKKLVKT